MAFFFRFRSPVGRTLRASTRLAPSSPFGESGHWRHGHASGAMSGAAWFEYAHVLEPHGDPMRGLARRAQTGPGGWASVRVSSAAIRRWARACTVLDRLDPDEILVPAIVRPCAEPVTVRDALAWCRWWAFWMRRTHRIGGTLEIL